LYDKPTINRLTQRPTTPDYRAIVEAIARRDQLRLLVDGMTAANDFGLMDAVSARLTIHTDARRRAIKLDKLTIDSKQTAPSTRSSSSTAFDSGTTAAASCATADSASRATTMMCTA
jgi:hypothetical protein